MTVEKLLEVLSADKALGPNIVHRAVIPPRKARLAPMPEELAPPLRQRLAAMGLERLYAHQAEAITAALDGANVIVATPTASGKSLCYLAPVLDAFIMERDATALFLFPLKALEHDQIEAYRELAFGLPGDLRAVVFDGDTKKSAREAILAHPPRAIFTNPDMLHLSMLPYHAKWEKFLRALRYIVIDETHTYRGVFGSHVAQVLRRLERVLKRYGANPQILASSATIANPGQFAATLTGREFRVVADSGAPRPGGHFVVYNTEASPYTDASKILRAAVRQNLKTIAFTKARKITELIYTWTVQAEPELAARLGCYRAGYLPEERRQIERDLFGGKLDGVVTTSALEMGVDIGGLDVCVLVGYPGSIISSWQRAGRVGRGEREFLVFLVAQQDALDQYFVHHPSELFTRGYEAAIIDPENEPIQKHHIVLAAAEAPITNDGAWPDPAARKKLIDELVAERRLALSADGTKWLCPRQYPHRDVSIRGIGESYAIFIEGGKAPLGHVGGGRVFSECHEGAVYLHRGQQYHVSRLDTEKRVIHVTPMDERYYTRPRVEKETAILETLREKTVHGFTVKLGRLKVSEQVTGYERKSIFGQEALGAFDLESPIIEFETMGYWVEIPDAVKEDIEARRLHYMGGIHAFEHAAIGLFPLFTLCDRDDIGGISYALYPPLGISAVFFYDGYPGGIGLCAAGYDKVEELWGATLKLVADCPCDTGCPSCVHSPKCGSGNKPLDKGAAGALLEYLTGAKPAPKRRAAAVHQPAPAVMAAAENSAQAGHDPAPDKRILFFDLETQRGADEVGGWGNVHLMSLAVAVVYDSLERRYTRYFEQDVHRLLDALLAADLVVGYNHVKFDYTVLSAYTDANLSAAARSFDILTDVTARLGWRPKLDHLAQATLRRAKTADGLASLRWWKEGKRDQVADYCEKDVEITKELFEYGLEHGHLIYTLKSGEAARLKVDWDLDTIIARAAQGAAPRKRIRF
ncbi:MAG: DEAD/DEAH box helicase [Nitrospinae bacterium]|nr:DEAD/DEAH box helicase [Nitrospinota bacterium]